MSAPWMKFYASDWRSDPRLKMCSAGARGVWIEMICLMHEATPYGHLLVHGQPPNEAQLASLTGIPSAELNHLVAELERMGVFSRTKEGVIYSRKLVRMAAKSAKARKIGKLGGNPTLCKKEDFPPSDNPQDNGKVKTQKPEARSQKEEREDPPPPDPTTARGQAAVAVEDTRDEFEAILEAAGIDWRRDVTGKWFGTNPRWTVERWRALGLSQAEIVAVLAESRPRTGPPGSLAYFDQAMQRAAGRKKVAPLAPIIPTGGALHADPAAKRRASWRKLATGLPDPGAAA